MTHKNFSRYQCYTAAANAGKIRFFPTRGSECGNGNAKNSPLNGAVIEIVGSWKLERGGKNRVSVGKIEKSSTNLTQRATC